MRKLWIIILCAAILGAVLMIGGFVLGADTNIYIDENGFTTDSEDDYQEISQRDTTEISQIEIDTASADIEIIPSDGYGFDLTGRSLVYSFEDGKLKVDQKNSLFKWRLFGFYNENESIKIYLPSGAYLENVNIESSSGRIKVTELNADAIYIDLVSGQTTMRSIEANTITAESTSGDIDISDAKADRFDFVLTSGHLTMSGIESDGFAAKLTSGGAGLEGDFRGSNIIEVTSGNVNMDITGRKNDYSRFISVVSGSVFIDGERGAGNDSNTGAHNSLEIDVTSGSVKINFGK